MTDPRPVTEVLVQAIRDARDREGWNARTLADACAQAGMPSLDQSTITNILNNRRQRIGVDEWLTLAYVLNLPPAQMLLPLTESDRAALTPAVTTGHDAALKWLLGEEGAPLPNGEPRDARAWERNGAPLLYWRALWKQIEEVDRLWHERAARAGDIAANPDSPLGPEFMQSLLTNADQRLAGALRHYAELHNVMRHLKLSPPAPSPLFVQEMERLEVPFGEELDL
jgi:hypothetical protein